MLSLFKSPQSPKGRRTVCVCCDRSAANLNRAVLKPGVDTAGRPQVFKLHETWNLDIETKPLKRGLWPERNAFGLIADVEETKHPHHDNIHKNELPKQLV